MRKLVSLCFLAVFGLGVLVGCTEPASKNKPAEDESTSAAPAPGTTAEK